jgi:hypothetical protein
MKAIFFTIAVSATCFAQTVEIHFEVVFNKSTIGTLTASEQKDGKNAVKELKTLVDTKVLALAIHVESEEVVKKENDILLEGTAYRHANRSKNDVHAHVIRENNKNYQVERNGTSTSIGDQDITWCIIDFYFAEPKNITSVFSNMYADHLELRKIAEGKYQLITPDNKNSYYTYEEGRLVMIESDTPVGKVISKRM